MAPSRAFAPVLRAAAALLLVLLVSPREADAIPATLVYVNGVPSPVYFNDGDTFRVLAGPYQGMKARLQGFNTLESNGPVHSWGPWDGNETYVIAKMATHNARRGVWHCTAELSNTDHYGRTLTTCPDLILDQLRRGFAHAMSIDETPAAAWMLVAQRDAQAHRRGLWARGIPDYIMTSVHSVDEGFGRGYAYNRVVSTFDGHSVKWQHADAYRECQKVCIPESPLPGMPRAPNMQACMVYVPFERWYGPDRATCLQHH